MTTQQNIRVQFVRDGVEQYHVLRVSEYPQAPGKPTLYFATSDNGLGCGKNYPTPKDAAIGLIRASFPCTILFACNA